MIDTRTDAQFDKFNASVSAAVDAVRHTSEAIAATAQEQTTLMVALSESAGILAKQSRDTADRLTGSPVASWPTARGPSASRDTMARRVPSASASQRTTSRLDSTNR